MGDLRLRGRFPDEHVRDLVARLQRLQLVYLHPRYVSLETVELEQQTHLRAKHREWGEKEMAVGGSRRSKDREERRREFHYSLINT